MYSELVLWSMYNYVYTTVHVHVQCIVSSPGHLCTPRVNDIIINSTFSPNNISVVNFKNKIPLFKALVHSPTVEY